MLRSGLVTLALLVLCEGGARAETQDVVVLGGGAPFRDALAVALAAWDLHVVTADLPRPSSELPRGAREARAIAAERAAGSVVWVGGSDAEPGLFVYDGATDQVVSRSLAHRAPFDPPTAAAAALTVKTLLRASLVAPPSERIGAVAVPAVASPSPEAAKVEPPPVAKRALRVEVGGGARAIADRADARVSLGATYFVGERLGIGLTAWAGPGVDVGTPRFRGRFNELAIGPSLRARIPLAGPVALEPRLGLTLHATEIDGVAVTTAAEATTRTRIDGSADAGCAFDLALTTATSIAIDLSASYLLRYQRYFVADQTVFELRPFQAFAGLRLGVTLQ